jgi:hypothetical protein
VSVSWGFIFIVVGWKGDYKVVGMDRDKFYFYCYFVEGRL